VSFTQLFYHIIWATKNRQPLITSQIETVIYDYLRAKFIGQIKAVASTKFNKSYPDLPAFFWQAEYGVFTFDGKRLPNYIAYVERQKEHHG
jgi:putative transposase